MALHVYILASGRDGTLYVGGTNDLARRVHEHEAKVTSGFTATYGADRSVWYEAYPRIVDAIDREKALKTWRRAWKIRLIEDFNPDWSDLYPTLIPSGADLDRWPRSSRPSDDRRPAVAGGPAME